MSNGLGLGCSQRGEILWPRTVLCASSRDEIYLDDRFRVYKDDNHRSSQDVEDDLQLGVDKGSPCRQVILLLRIQSKSLALGQFHSKPASKRGMTRAETRGKPTGK
jgi:hypothetical protein